MFVKKKFPEGSEQHISTPKDDLEVHDFGHSGGIKATHRKILLLAKSSPAADIQ